MKRRWWHLDGGADFNGEPPKSAYSWLIALLLVIALVIFLQCTLGCATTPACGPECCADCPCYPEVEILEVPSEPIVLLPPVPEVPPTPPLQAHDLLASDAAGAAVTLECLVKGLATDVVSLSWALLRCQGAIQNLHDAKPTLPPPQP